MTCDGDIETTKATRRSDEKEMDGEMNRDRRENNDDECQTREATMVMMKLVLTIDCLSISDEMMSRAIRRREDEDWKKFYRPKNLRVGEEEDERRKKWARGSLLEKRGVRIKRERQKQGK